MSITKISIFYYLQCLKLVAVRRDDMKREGIHVKYKFMTIYIEHIHIHVVICFMTYEFADGEINPSSSR